MASPLKKNSSSKISNHNIYKNIILTNIIWHNIFIAKRFTDVLLKEKKYYTVNTNQMVLKNQPVNTPLWKVHQT
jgi:hypothetical protein